MGVQSVELTGKASIDKPWLQFYPEEIRNAKVPRVSLETFLKNRVQDWNKIAFEYYGYRMTWKKFWAEVEVAAKALAALGFGEGDRIPTFLLSCPSHFILLLAAEKIGAALICRDDTPEELAFAIRKSRASVAFAHDFVSKEDEAFFRATTPMARMVKVSPYDYADKASVSDYIKESIDSYYSAETENAEDDLTWNEFMELGRNYKGEYLAKENIDRPLFGAYTSGSTGISKLVIHSGANIVATAFQLTLYIPVMDHQEKWWLPILPPALIAVTVSMAIMPMAAGMVTVLDPFCPLEKIDIALMQQKPNFMAFVPMICEMLMKSKNIPADYDMSHLRSIGTGAEAMNERKSREVEAFFQSHGVQAKLSAGYGQSEGCSSFMLPNPMFPLVDGCVGMPLPQTVMGIFDEETMEEKGYGEYGELCVDSPAIMLEYSGWMGKEMTERTLIRHRDGKVWLHTGDTAYITEHGIVHILGRGHARVYGGGELFLMRMESRVVEVPGVNDGFFCAVPNQEHEGYFVPYLFVVLDEGKTLADVEEGIRAVLEKHEQPQEIRVIDERPYFHFKTNRKELTAAIVKELKDKAKAKGNGKVKVTWSHNDRATGYQIRYSKSADFKSFEILDVPSPKTVQEVLHGFDQGERYYVQVRACNSATATTYYSAWSAVESIIHTSITAENTASGIEVMWNKVKGATEYRVFRKKAGDSGYIRIATVTEATSYIDPTVENGVRYCYYVSPQVAGVKATSNAIVKMYLEAPGIEKLFNY